MSSAITPGPLPPLNVGVYGTTRAGKTRFLYELLAGWHRDYRLVERSEQAIKFLQEVEPDIRTYNESRGTVATLEGIKVVVQRGGDQPPWTLTFRDLRGEFLAQEVDDLHKAGQQQQAAIPRQVRECNSFVFFFDPTSEDAPDQLEAHHERELRRAGRFIDYVLAQRQNRYLPILFVLTRLDRWEEDPELQASVSAWIDRVNEKMRTAYRKALGKHFPPRLVDPLATMLCISSVRANEVEPVVERLSELVQDCAEFQSADRRRTRSVLGVLTLTLGLFLLLSAGVFLWVREGKPTTNPNKTQNKPVREWAPDEVTAQLEELDRQLGTHPRGDTLPTVADARTLNDGFRWLPAKLEWTRNDSAFTPALRQRMQATLDRLIGVVQTKLVQPPGEPLGPRWQIVNAYLEDVPDAPEQRALEQLRGDAWTLGRALVAQEIAGILKRRDAVASAPADAIGEVLSLLRTQEQELRRTHIGGLKAQQALVADIQTAATFLEDRKNTKTYGAKFTVVSARVSAQVAGGTVSDATCGLTWRSPTNDPDSKNNYELVPTRIDASEVTFRTKSAEYPIKFGLGGPVLLKLMVWNDAAERDPDLSKYQPLHDFDLSAKGFAGPLRVLGLPLLVPGETTYRKKVDWQGYEIKFELNDLPRVPPLLAEATARFQGGGP
jgi:hypothetical protein